MSKNKAKLGIYGLLLMISLVSTLLIVTKLKGLLLRSELIIFTILLLVSISSLIMYNRGDKEALISFILLFLNACFLAYFGKVSFFLFISSVLGIIISAISNCPKCYKNTSCEIEEELHNEVFENTNEEKYVAKKGSSVYHIPSCVIAKKIAKENKEYFMEIPKKLRAHSCVIPKDKN